MCGLQRLASLTQQAVLGVYFILPLSNSSLCGYTTFCVSIRQLMDAWGVSRFEAMMCNAVLNLFSRFCVDIGFLFSWVNT